MKAIKEITNSSQVSQIAYDAETETLYVTYKPKGTEYEYKGVPADKWEGICAAESVGKYLNAEIKGKYGFKMIA